MTNSIVGISRVASLRFFLAVAEKNVENKKMVNFTSPVVFTSDI